MNRRNGTEITAIIQTVPVDSLLLINATVISIIAANIISNRETFLDLQRKMIIFFIGVTPFS
jgi:hypothetical protein